MCSSWRAGRRPGFGQPITSTRYVETGKRCMPLELRKYPRQPKKGPAITSRKPFQWLLIWAAFPVTQSHLVPVSSSVLPAHLPMNSGCAPRSPRHNSVANLARTWIWLWQLISYPEPSLGKFTATWQVLSVSDSPLSSLLDQAQNQNQQRTSD